MALSLHCVLIAAIFVGFNVEAQNWKGNVVSYSEQVISTCYRCLVHYTWGCGTCGHYQCTVWSTKQRCANGWTHKGDFNCIIPICSPACLNNASCSSPNKCNCIPGYTGNNCMQNVNECVSAPCRNNGTCIDLVNGYTCKCASGFTGEQCTIDVNECVSAPCRNNGTCIDLVNGYTCKCASGFTGSEHHIQ
ncbi:hypothetical protein DPMN_124990 [Dreissena polymorpha]|uniref:EGF-like domain-containing protein n=1 Tax=Dreissena polymorpha TaxID=45954 RepID=A0A9D4JT29_DREPO|nr:hypothetical protein DPMN_124990 [Dreissena polymorpha]